MILQLNTDGLRNSRAEIIQFLQDHSIKIAAIQETKLQPSSAPIDFPNYKLIRRDRPAANGGGGLAFLVHHSISYVEEEVDHLCDHHLEVQSITATINQTELQLFNIYLPPASSCPGYSLSSDTLDSLLNCSDGD